MRTPQYASRAHPVQFYHHSQPLAFLSLPGWYTVSGCGVVQGTSTHLGPGATPQPRYLNLNVLTLSASLCPPPPQEQNAPGTGLRSKDYLECKFGTTCPTPWLCQLWGALYVMSHGSTGAGHSSPQPCCLLLPAGLRCPCASGLLPLPTVSPHPN